MRYIDESSDIQLYRYVIQKLRMKAHALASKFTFLEEQEILRETPHSSYSKSYTENNLLESICIYFFICKWLRSKHHLWILIRFEFTSPSPSLAFVCLFRCKNRNQVKSRVSNVRRRKMDIGCLTVPSGMALATDSNNANASNVKTLWMKLHSCSRTHTQRATHTFRSCFFTAHTANRHLNLRWMEIIFNGFPSQPTDTEISFEAGNTQSIDTKEIEDETWHRTSICHDHDKHMKHWQDF